MNGAACIICEEPIAGPPFGPLDAPQCQACWLAVGVNGTAALEDLRLIQGLYPSMARDRDEVRAQLMAFTEEDEEDED